MPRAFAELTFTPNVRAMQEKQGSADSYARFLAPEVSGGDIFTAREAAFISQRDGFYQATVSETGWPYLQFRGGPRGFLKLLDAKHLAYADFRGNRQYLSVGNLQANERIALFLMDYPNRRRLKILGTVELVEAADDPALVASLHDPEYDAVPERAFVITLAAFDWNCPQHIPQRFTAEELAALA
ncbi:pyridoxamine 5'-phosphate oxidase family protein [Altererythrobacter arenosus]|uniref:Pyridoxamine 5'-phosphate oxidase family protein n=1 Tax=Altererythrobacter arenosus TaxID=3032592 RepID=A0ABY8FTP4_9SPHN|nr:pyridoxamine 5'-phosphate oxidase family protein [Altererythrobacter sp. CAU 1644]WFL78368.1 pyridoxamine 5'-phosphate oxidase family protein [Altererythrobacter sp. CAU 1644]